MKRKTLKLFTLLMGILFLTDLHAQQTTSSAGGNIKDASGSISYSIGQVLYSTQSGTNGFLVQGVQQPYEISILTSLQKEIGVDISIIAFPNPANDFIILIVDSGSGVNEYNLSAELYDVNGKILQKREFYDNESKIDMSKHVTGTYLLRVLVNIQESPIEFQTFKIIKH